MSIIINYYIIIKAKKKRAIDFTLLNAQIFNNVYVSARLIKAFRVTKSPGTESYKKAIYFKLINNFQKKNSYGIAGGKCGV